MNIEEAIIHARQVAEGCPAGDRDCAYQHDMLADWLEELQAYRALGSLDYLRKLMKVNDRDNLHENGEEENHRGAASDGLSVSLSKVAKEVCF